MIDPQNGTAVHHALGDDRRARIVQELESAGRPLDANALGRRVGLHANTVRWHFGQPRPRGKGRVPAARNRARRNDRADGRRSGRLRTRRVGLGTRPRPQPGAPPEVDEEQAITHVVDLLAEQGFEPSAQGRRIEMRRCPFHDLAETYSRGRLRPPPRPHLGSARRARPEARSRPARDLPPAGRLHRAPSARRDRCGGCRGLEQGQRLVASLCAAHAEHFAAPVTQRTSTVPRHRRSFTILRRAQLKGE